MVPVNGDFCFGSGAKVSKNVVEYQKMDYETKKKAAIHEKAPESFDSEALDHDYYIWVKNGNLRKLKRGIYHKEL